MTRPGSATGERRRNRTEAPRGPEALQDLRARSAASRRRDGAERGTARRARLARPRRTRRAAAGRASVFIVSTSTADPDERRPSDEGLVEDDADAVPVRSRCQRLGHRLLGRHVADRAHDLFRDGEVLVDLVREVGRHPEVEDHHATVRRDEDVRRLDVAVELARGVHGLHALDELPQRAAQQVEVGRRRLWQRPQRGRRVLRAEPDGRGHRLRTRVRDAHDARRRRRLATRARLLDVLRKSVPLTSSIVKKTSSPSVTTSS